MSLTIEYAVLLDIAKEQLAQSTAAQFLGGSADSVGRVEVIIEKAVLCHEESTSGGVHSFSASAVAFVGSYQVYSPGGAVTYDSAAPTDETGITDYDEPSWLVGRDILLVINAETGEVLKPVSR